MLPDLISATGVPSKLPTGLANAQRFLMRSQLKHFLQRKVGFSDSETEAMPTQCSEKTLYFYHHFIFMC